MADDYPSLCQLKVAFDSFSVCCSYAVKDVLHSYGRWPFSCLLRNSKSSSPLEAEWVRNSSIFLSLPCIMDDTLHGIQSKWRMSVLYAISVAELPYYSGRYHSDFCNRMAVIILYAHNFELNAFSIRPIVQEQWHWQEHRLRRL